MWAALFQAVAGAATSDAAGGGAPAGSGGGWFSGQRSIETPNDAFVLTPNDVTYNKGLDLGNPTTMIGLAVVAVAAVWMWQRK